MQAGGSSPLLPPAPLRRDLTTSISPWADCVGRNILPEGSEDFVTGWVAYGGAEVTVTPVTETINGEEVQAYRIQSTGGTSVVKYKSRTLTRIPGRIINCKLWAKTNSGNAKYYMVQGSYITITSDWVSNIRQMVEVEGSDCYCLFATDNVADSLDITVYHPQLNLNQLYPYSPPAGMPIFPAGLSDAVDTTSPASAPSDVEDGADAQVGVSGLTTTNLLGEYGSFAVDSNGDGLADGWEGHYSPTGMSLLNGVQKFTPCKYGAIRTTNTYTYHIGHVYVMFAVVATADDKASWIGFCDKYDDFNNLDGANVIVATPASDCSCQLAIRSLNDNPSEIAVSEFSIIDLTTDCPALLDSLCVDPTAPTTAEKEAIEAWCLANLSYHDNTASLTSPVIVSTDSEGGTTSKTLTDLVLRSVPAIADEVNPDGSVTRNIAEHILTVDDISSLYTGFTNIDVVRTRLNSILDSNWESWKNNVIGGDVAVPGVEEIAFDDSVNLSGCFYTSQTAGIGFLVAKGTYTTLSEAKADLTGTVVRYQLATPTTDATIYDNLIPAHDGGTISCAGSSALSIEWPLEAIVLKDNSGHRNSLLFGEGASAPTVDGKAIVFDGVDDYGIVKNLQNTFTDAFTLFFVGSNTAGTEPVSTYSTLMGQFAVNYIFTPSASGYRSLRFYGILGGIAYDISGAEWTSESYPYDVEPKLPSDISPFSCGVTYDGSRIRSYVNGQYKGSFAASGNVAINTYPFTVGNRPSSLSRGLKGNMNMFSSFHRCLSPAEIAQLDMDAKRKLAPLGVTW